jgi:hypothetical protein
MLSIIDPARRIGRRDMLRIGGMGLAGLGLQGLTGGPAMAANAGLLSGKSVVFLFLHGGPSQFETFDPKMSAPSDIRGVTGEIATAVPGLTFGSSFPRMATLADRLTVVRSFTTGDANHDIKPVVGRDSYGANLGSLFARVAGANHPLTGMPTNAALFPQAVDDTTGPAITSFGNFAATGPVGSGYAPFVPGAGGDLQQDMELKLPSDRLGDRRTLLGGLDRLRRALEAGGKLNDLDSIRAQAFTTLLGGVAGAFDLSREDPGTIDRYDTAPLVRPDQIDKKWNNYNHYCDNAKALGKLLLLARRLCESGCGFVTVTTSFVWDMHADVNNATVEEGMRYMGPPLDHAVSAFLEDVRDRGLSDRILLVITGEMGRTPRINANGGRDHWGNLAPLVLAGGELPMGRVLGQSTRDGGEPATQPVTNKHLNATILQTLTDAGQVRVMRGLPDEVIQAANAEAIPGLS